MSQFCNVSGFRFMLHSPSSSTSPWLLRHTTSLLRWPTPHGTEHLRETGKWERRVGRRKGMCCFWAKTLHFSIIWKYKTCTPSALVKKSADFLHHCDKRMFIRCVFSPGSTQTGSPTGCKSSADMWTWSPAYQTAHTSPVPR